MAAEHGVGNADASGARGTALRWAAALGAWSVASGFAVFLYLLAGKEHGMKLLAGALVVAGIVALLTECVKDLVREGAISKHQGVSRPSRIVVAALMMAVFELFVGAWHHLTAEHETAEAGVRDTVLGPMLADTAGATASLVILVALWLLVGAAVAWRLAALAFSDPTPAAASVPSGEAARRSALGAGAGALVGAAVPAVLVLGYVLSARTVAGLFAMLFHHADYAAHLDAIDRAGGFLAVVCTPVRWLDAVWSAVPWTKAVVLAVFVLRKAWKVFVGAVLVAVTLPPLLGDLGHVASLLGFAALVWALPCAALGALLPYLRRPSAAPRVWGGVALAAATVLVLLTLLGFASAWLLLPASLLVATGVLFGRGATLDEWWPLLALSVGLLVGGVSLGLQRMTFLGVFTDFLAVNALPTVESDDGGLLRDPGAGAFVGRRDPQTATFLAEAAQIPELDPARREASALDLLRRVREALAEKSPPPLVPGTSLPSLGGLGHIAAFPELRALESRLNRYIEGLRRHRVEGRALARARERWEEEGTARDLQVSLAGSVGFWVTLALLAAWSIRRRAEEGPTSVAH